MPWLKQSDDDTKGNTYYRIPKDVGIKRIKGGNRGEDVVLLGKVSLGFKRDIRWGNGDKMMKTHRGFI